MFVVVTKQNKNQKNKIKQNRVRDFNTLFD